MCGICGVFDYASGRPAERDRIGRARALMRHRGPDDSGEYFADSCGVALGHTRLSIIDVDAGHQPLCNEDESVFVVFNGEIYNFHELRAFLLSRGHQFRTRCDTEVLVHLYEERGDDFVRELHGDFAFALWDERRRKMILARDRLGVKPLYYCDRGGRLAFGSTLPATLASCDVPRDIDPHGLFCYATFQTIQAPLTIYRDVRKLPPGHVLQVSAAGVLTPRPFWDFDMAPEDACPFPERSIELGGLLRNAVQRQMIADVPIGAFLSGGVDSSAVVKLMHDASGSGLATFSIGFAESAYDESPFFRRFSTLLGVDHHEVLFEPRLLDDAVQIVRMFGEPCSIGSAFPLYHLARCAAQSVKVVLSGDGPDEVFAGYEQRYRHLRRLVTLQTACPRPLLGALDHVLGRLEAAGTPSPTANGLRRLRKATHAARLQRCDWLPFLAMNRTASTAPAALLSPDVIRQVDQPLPYVQAFERYAGSRDWMTPFVYADIRTMLPDEMFMKLDSMTMAHSIEGRVPLCDHRIVEFSGRLPSRMKFQGGLGKRIFRSAVAPLLPREILARPKVGFRVPFNEWFRGGLAPLAAGLTESPAITCSGLFNVAAVRRVVDEHACGKNHYGAVLWSLAAFDLWWRALHRETTTTPASPSASIG
ncbi:MAG: asparagine synthase (glutamine-hydrolyzing) [Phycisphaerales bacterium]|nr:asparagine synthase (glutamine-hydrolyzing) [Phycisphaerales bacterium]